MTSPRSSVANTLLTAAGLFILGAAVAWGQDPRPRPKGFPPKVSLAKAQLKDGVVQLRLTTPEIVPAYETREVVKNGKKVNEKVLVYHTEFVERVVAIDGKDMQVVTKAGKAVEAEALPKLLANDTPVLVSFDGAVDPFYLAVVRDDVLVVTKKKAAE